MFCKKNINSLRQSQSLVSHKFRVHSSYSTKLSATFVKIIKVNKNNKRVYYFFCKRCKRLLFIYLWLMG